MTKPATENTAESEQPAQGVTAEAQEQHPKEPQVILNLTFPATRSDVQEW
ncbi:hypothetical protein ABZ605_28350 [Streptomyces sp. NPDC012765]